MSRGLLDGVQQEPVDVATQASRIRYAAAYLEFLSGYFGADLPKEQRAQLKESTDIGMRALLSNMTQQVAKTNARELELRPALMRAVWEYIKVRRSIKAARRVPQLIISDEGEALSAQSITKLFADLRRACPGLPVNLTSHVMRHTWNERFSEQAEHMQLSDSVEERARNEQQGWADDSKMSKTYTRRHAQAKGRQVALKLQEALDAPEK